MLPRVLRLLVDTFLSPGLSSINGEREGERGGQRGGGVEWGGVGRRRELEIDEDRERHRDRDRETQTETEIEPLEGEAARRRGTEQERPTAHTPFPSPCPLLPARCDWQEIEAFYKKN
jgi:hypothetical protein